MDCPAEQTLRRLALGSLPTLEHQKVTDHLRNCSTCATLLRQFQDFPPPPADTVQTTPGSYGPAGPAAEAPPEVEGYALERALGEGGMGVVYLGRDTRLNRPVALKILRESLTAEAQAVRRFVEEAQVASQLQHPGIPPPSTRWANCPTAGPTSA
jgi:serine/threonine protein kinase